MSKIKTQRLSVTVLFKRALCNISQAYAWVMAVFLILLCVAVLFLDVIIPLIGIPTPDDMPLLISLPHFQLAFAWLLVNMSLGFTIYHLICKHTQSSLWRIWALVTLLGGTLLYWL
jgi:hypothetical protein